MTVLGRMGLSVTLGLAKELYETLGTNATGSTSADIYATLDCENMRMDTYKGIPVVYTNRKMKVNGHAAVGLRKCDDNGNDAIYIWNGLTPAEQRFALEHEYRHKPGRDMPAIEDEYTVNKMAWKYLMHTGDHEAAKVAERALRN